MDYSIFEELNVLASKNEIGVKVCSPCAVRSLIPHKFILKLILKNIFFPPEFDL